MSKTKKYLLALIVALVIACSTILCPICGLIGQFKMGLNGIYCVCPNGHAWK
jgi:hypothetical protein